MSNNDFAGRTALVTGGSRGIGAAICERLAESGARIALNYHSSEAAAEEVVSRIRDAGGQCRPWRADVSELAQVQAMVGEIERELGPIDFLVANAGIASAADKTDMEPDLWRRIIDVNLHGTFNTVWSVKDGMMARGAGSIVCISSILGLAMNPLALDRLIAYSTSKAAIIGFVRSAAAAFGPHVRVNGIAPGWIETDMTDNASEEARARLVAATPLKRTGAPDDIADAVNFFLSSEARFITGQTIAASGGLGTVP